MEDLDRWSGVLAGFSRPTADLDVWTVWQVAESGSQAFLADADDGNRYWVKHRDSPHGSYSLAVERIVAAVATVVDAPMRPIALVNVPEELWSVEPLKMLGIREGVAHASANLARNIEGEVLEHIPMDGNSGRAPRLMAMWDWFFGEDEQWLYALDEHNQVWSFDHGLWVIGGAERWDAGSLLHTVDLPSPLDRPVRGMDPRAFLDVAQRIEQIDPVTLQHCVADVPVEWEIPNEDLEALGWWLYVRRRKVADRMRARAAEASRR
ncbi:hypothetical protein BGP79_11960 [Tersicoccus sp. Bi-70]|nr:hypothetical protein BGP79_11960 [Tersicoccus sp. Bi-70]